MISYNNHKFFEREDNDDDERAAKHWSIRGTKERRRIMGTHKRRLLAYDDAVWCGAVLCSAVRQRGYGAEIKTQEGMRTKSH